MKSRKVVVVEDDKMLATVFSMFLKNLGHELLGFYTDGKEAIQKVEKEKPDVILMDIHLKGEIDGIKTTEIIQEKFDIPVIYISGDTESETIERAFKTKSYGYLVKPIDKTELGINIELACIKHKYDRDISIREKRYKNLIDVSPNSIIVVVDNIIEYVNYSGLKLFETIHIEHMLEKDFFSFIPGGYQGPLKKLFQELLDGKIKMLDYSPAKIKSLNNKEYSVGIVGSLIEFKHAKAIQLVISDHTEYLETKKLLTEQNNIINNTFDGISTISLGGIITSWNIGAERIYGHKPKEILNTKFVSLFPDKDDMYLQEIIVEKTLEKQNIEVELDYKHPLTGELKYVQLSLSVLTNLGDEITGLVCYTKDITDRKLKDLDLKKSENSLKAIFDGSTEAIFFVDQNLNILDSNRLAKQYAQKFFNTEISSQSNVFDILAFLDKTEFRLLFENALEGVSHFLERPLEIENKKHYFKITIYPVTSIDDESINRFCISFLDISDKKKTEKELEETHAELKPLFDSSIQRFYLSDLDAKLVAFNKAAKEIIQKEFRRNIRKGDNLFDFIPSEVGFEEFNKKFNTAKEGKHITFKVKIKNDDGEYWAEAHLDPIKDETGETRRILFWTLDITDREKNLAALQKSEERYALIASGGNDGLWDWDLANNELYVSPRWKAMIGFDEDETVTREIIKDTIIHPDDIEKVRKTLKSYIKGETKTYKNEYRVKHSSGEYHWILERGTALRDETGKTYRMAGSITDITDRKKAEEEINEINKALLEERRMFIKGNVVIFRVGASSNTDIVYVSENVKEVLGYTVEEFTSGETDFTSLIHPDDYKKHEEERLNAINDGLDHVEFPNYRLIRKDKKIIWIKDSTSILRDENGNVRQLLGYIVDISNEIRAEKGLEENQRKYYTLFNQASDAILLIDNDNILDCNHKAIKLFGYNKDEFIGRNLLELSPEHQTNGEPTAKKRIRKIDEIQDGSSRTFHWLYKRKDGSTFDSEVSLSLIEFDGKKVLHAIIRDITERIQIEKDLKESEQKTKMLLQAIPDLIFVVDREFKYIDYRPDNISGLSVPESDIIGKSVDEFFSGDSLVEMKEKIVTALEKNEIQKLEYELESPLGKRWFEARLAALNEEHVVVLARDVTERIEMQHKIKQINTELEEKIEALSQKDDKES